MFGSTSQNEKTLSEEELIAEILKEKPWEGFLYKITCFIRKYAVTLFTLCWFGPISLGIIAFGCLIISSIICDYYIKYKAVDLSITDEEYINSFVMRINISGTIVKNNSIKSIGILLIAGIILTFVSMHYLLEYYLLAIDFVIKPINTYFNCNIDPYKASSINNGVVFILLIAFVSLNAPLFNVYMIGLKEEYYFPIFSEYHFRPSIRIFFNYLLFSMIVFAVIVFKYLSSRVQYQENIKEILDINFISSVFLAYIFIYMILRFIYFKAMFVSFVYNTTSIKKE